MKFIKIVLTRMQLQLKLSGNESLSGKISSETNIEVIFGLLSKHKFSMTFRNFLERERKRLGRQGPMKVKEKDVLETSKKVSQNRNCLC